MANTISAAGVTQAISVATDIINLFNGWELQDAQYNGVKFYIANAIPGISNGTINNYAQVVNTVTNLIGNTESFPLNSSLPYGTQMFLKGVTDRTRRRVIVHESMNSNSNVLEDAGFEAERFSVLGIISGDSYYAAYKNLYDFFTARRGDQVFDQIPAQYQNVFTHPVRGNINNVLMEDLNVIHSYTKYKAIVFTATFVAAQIGNIRTSKTSLASQIAQGLSVVINSVAAVENAITDAQLALQSVSAIFYNPITQNTYTTTVAPIIKNTTIPMLNAAGAIMYQNLSPATQTNYYFKNQTIDYSLLPQLVPFSYGFDINSIGNLLSVYENQVQSNIDAINSLGYNIILNNLIAALKESYVALYNLGDIYSQNNEKTYKTYIVPYAMSIRSLCFLNGINFNNTDNLNTIYKLNSDKYTSSNFIPAGVNIILPNSLS